MEKKTIIELEAERLEWSLKVFTEATPISSMLKLIDEASEVIQELDNDFNEDELKAEYADCLMCLFDSAGRAGISPEAIFDAFEIKLAKNKARVWKKNPNNTYSHVK